MASSAVEDAPVATPEVPEVGAEAAVMTTEVDPADETLVEAPKEVEEGKKESKKEPHMKIGGYVFYKFPGDMVQNAATGQTEQENILQAFSLEAISEYPAWFQGRCKEGTNELLSLTDEDRDEESEFVFRNTGKPWKGARIFAKWEAGMGREHLRLQLDDMIQVHEYMRNVLKTPAEACYGLLMTCYKSRLLKSRYLTCMKKKFGAGALLKEDHVNPKGYIPTPGYGLQKELPISESEPERDAGKDTADDGATFVRPAAPAPGASGTAPNAPLEIPDMSDSDSANASSDGEASGASPEDSPAKKRKGGKADPPPRSATARKSTTSGGTLRAGTSAESGGASAAAGGSGGGEDDDPDPNKRKKGGRGSSRATSKSSDKSSKSRSASQESAEGATGRKKARTTPETPPTASTSRREESPTTSRGRSQSKRGDKVDKRSKKRGAEDDPEEALPVRIRFGDEDFPTYEYRPDAKAKIKIAGQEIDLRNHWEVMSFIKNDELRLVAEMMWRRMTVAERERDEMRDEIRHLRTALGRLDNRSKGMEANVEHMATEATSSMRGLTGDPYKHAELPWDDPETMHRVMSDQDKRHSLVVYMGTLHYSQGQPVSDFLGKLLTSEFSNYVRHYVGSHKKLASHEFIWLMGQAVAELHRDLVNVFIDSLRISRGGPTQFKADQEAPHIAKWETSTKTHFKKHACHHIRAVVLANFYVIHNEDTNDDRAMALALLYFDEDKKTYVVKCKFPGLDLDGRVTKTTSCRKFWRYFLPHIASKWVANGKAQSAQKNHDTEAMDCFPERFIRFKVTDEISAKYHAYTKSWNNDEYQADNRAILAYANSMIDSHLKDVKQKKKAEREAREAAEQAETDTGEA